MIRCDAEPSSVAELTLQEDKTIQTVRQLAKLNAGKFNMEDHSLIINLLVYRSSLLVYFRQYFSDFAVLTIQLSSRTSISPVLIWITID